MMRAVRMPSMDGEVRSLYEASFSDIEKIPQENISRALSSGAFLDRYEESGNFIGFTMGFIDGDRIFLIYFATRPEVRGKGYGSRILDMLRSEFPGHRMFLVTEPLDPDAPDIDIRRRRQDFYRRNGCRDTGVRVISDDAWFDTMFVQGELSEEEMVSVIGLYEDIHNGRKHRLRSVASTA